MDKIIGIDISKQTFDVCFKEKQELSQKVYGNSLTGFKRFIGLLDPDSHVVMEASGPYYVPLATYLHGHGYKVSVVNPLKIRRYAQMRFYRAKTDKKDAQAIMEYATMNPQELPVYQPESKTTQSLKQMHTALELLQKQRHQSKRQLEAFRATGYVDTHVSSSLISMVKTLENRIRKIEEQMSALCKANCSDSYQALTSIPSIGDKTAIMLIAITDSFKKFTHYKQLIAYVGLSPRVYQSGTSIKGKGHICKMGKSQIRKLLYMCSWTAKKYNKSCREMYQRLKAKGKPERVIKIAIANKLLKQAFAIGKSKENYNENYPIKVCF